MVAAPGRAPSSTFTIRCGVEISTLGLSRMRANVGRCAFKSCVYEPQKRTSKSGATFSEASHTWRKQLYACSQSSSV